MSTLVDMLVAQRDLQTEAYGKDPTELEGDERVEFIRWNMLALENELHEALSEVGWKPWATSRHVNEEAFMKEMVDAWHFFMNLMWVVYGRTVLGNAQRLEERFTTEYYAKKKINAQRQVDGYDGVSTKCPKCHRDLAESSCVVDFALTSGQCVTHGAWTAP